MEKLELKEIKELVLYENAQDCLYYGCAISSNETNKKIIKELGKKRAKEIIEKALLSLIQPIKIIKLYEAK